MNLLENLQEEIQIIAQKYLQNIALEDRHFAVIMNKSYYDNFTEELTNRMQLISEYGEIANEVRDDNKNYKFTKFYSGVCGFINIYLDESQKQDYIIYTKYD